MYNMCAVCVFTNTTWHSVMWQATAVVGTHEIIRSGNGQTPQMTKQV